MKRSLIALALMCAVAAASAMAVFPASPPGLHASGNPVATQSVTEVREAAAAVQVVKIASHDAITLKVSDSGSGADSAYQAWVARQSVASMHPGCGERETHPAMDRKKGGGGKRCIESSPRS